MAFLRSLSLIQGTLLKLATISKQYQKIEPNNDIRQDMEKNCANRQSKK